MAKIPIINQSTEEQDKYLTKYLRLIADANFDANKIMEILDRVYQDGFEDGANNAI